MADGNQEILDQSVRYAVFLERYKSGVVGRIQDVILEADLEDVERLERALGRLSGADLRRFSMGRRATTQAGQAFEQLLREMRQTAARRIQEQVVAEVAPIAGLKTARDQRAAASIGLTLGRPLERTVRRALTTEPFQGRILREWASEWSEARVKRVTNELRLGLSRGESIGDMVKRLRGTRARKYRDGVLNVSRRSAATIARTASNHMVSQSDAAHVAENARLIQWVVWTSVLDSRTSDICRANDGRQFRSDDNWQGLLPAHPNCRSVWTYIYRGQGKREDRDYYDWLRDQDRSLVEEALGVKKAALFLDGGLGKRELVREATTGETYTLEQLRQREAQAFEAAGL